MQKLLIVDDEINIRKVIKEYGEFNGYQVDESADGMNAVSLCKKNDYDLIIMDIMMHRVDGQRIELTPKEYELLFYMALNKNIALSRDKLLSDIWGYDFFGDDRTIDTHIKNLRNNLGKYRDFIVTLRGVGYKFEV